MNTNHYRITITLSPLSELECHRALDAIHQYWTRPERIERRPWQGAFVLTVAAETTLPKFETESAMAKRLSTSIWRRLGRYVRVSVDCVSTSSDADSHHVFDESRYRELMEWR